MRVSDSMGTERIDCPHFSSEVTGHKHVYGHLGQQRVPMAFYVSLSDR